MLRGTEVKCYDKKREEEEEGMSWNTILLYGGRIISKMTISIQYYSTTI